MPSEPELPPEDRAASPRTGWTRAHWEAVADRVLDALVPFATPDFALVRPPGRASRSGELSDGLEGYARSFLTAAFRIAGDGGTGPRAGELVERYARGLAAGTDPAGPHAWPALADRGQPLVEAASIALALHETRRWLWDRLPPSTQDQVLGWLGGMTGRVTPDNNWVLFQVVTEQFLASVGGPHDPAEIERGLDRIEGWYRGGGWYTDGDGQNFDYYVGWTLHLYPLLWTRMAGAADGGRGAAYRARLAEFLGGYAHFFGADGAPVHHGRSLTYRFATAGPLWLGALFDTGPLAPGQVCRLASGVLRHFVEHGAPDERGLLTLGWHREFPPAVQPYSGPGSPYWSSKGFLGLVLPPDHPVWTDPERDAPNDTTDRVVALPQPGFVLSSTHRDGLVRLANHGSDHVRPAAPADDPHYAKLSYSTRTAPLTTPEPWHATVDNHLALVSPDGTPTRRVHIHRLPHVPATDRYATSRHTVEGGHLVETATVLRGPWEIRAHLVDAPAGWTVRDGGHAVAGDEPPETHSGAAGAVVRRSDDGLTSLVVGLHGWSRAGVRTDVEASAFGPYAATPCLVMPGHPGGQSIHVSLVMLTGDPMVDTDPVALMSAFRVEVGGRTVTVTYPDGERVTVGLGEVAPGGLRYRREPVDPEGDGEPVEVREPLPASTPSPS
jgi:hypothetical protein